MYHTSISYLTCLTTLLGLLMFLLLLLFSLLCSLCSALGSTSIIPAPGTPTTPTSSSSINPQTPTKSIGAAATTTAAVPQSLFSTLLTPYLPTFLTASRRKTLHSTEGLLTPFTPPPPTPHLPSSTSSSSSSGTTTLSSSSSQPTLHLNHHHHHHHHPSPNRPPMSPINTSIKHHPHGSSSYTKSGSPVSRRPASPSPLGGPAWGSSVGTMEGMVPGSPLRRASSSSYLPYYEEDSEGAVEIGSSDEVGGAQGGGGGGLGGSLGRNNIVGFGNGSSSSKGTGLSTMAGGAGCGGSLVGLGVLSPKRTTNRSRAGSWKES